MPNINTEHRATHFKLPSEHHRCGMKRELSASQTHFSVKQYSYLATSGSSFFIDPTPAGTSAEVTTAALGLSLASCSRAILLMYASWMARARLIYSAKSDITPGKVIEEGPR